MARSDIKNTITTCSNKPNQTALECRCRRRRRCHVVLLPLFARHAHGDPQTSPPTPSRVRHATADNARGVGSARVVLHLVMFDGKLQEESPGGKGDFAFAHHSGPLGRLRLSLRYHAFSVSSCQLDWKLAEDFFGFCPILMSIGVAETNGNDNSKTTPKSFWWSRGFGCRIQQVPDSNGDEQNIMKMLSV